MATNGSNRIGKTNFEKAFSRKTRNKLRNKIQEIKRSKQGLSTNFLNSVLKNIPHFIGVFPQDYLLNLEITSLPVKLVINLDLSSQPGTHWLALSITDSRLEIFDSLGLDSSTWSRKPIILLKFIEKLSKSRTILISPRLQSSYSNFCGVYSIFFLALCSRFTFHEICDLFSENFILNDMILTSFIE